MFCVYITFYRGNKLPPFYIGYTSIQKINNGYHGSVCSKQYKDIWKYELKFNNELFKTKILSIHLTKKEANNREIFIQQKLNVIKNSLYINQSAYPHFAANITTGTFKGKKHSAETKLKMRNAKLGKKTNRKWNPSEDTRMKMRLARLGKPGPNKGKFFSEEHRKNISLSKLGKPSTLKGIKRTKNVWNKGLKKENSSILYDLGQSVSKWRTRKTYEEIFGIEKAQEIKEKRSKRMKLYNETKKKK